MIVTSMHCGSRADTASWLAAEFLTAGKSNIRLLVPANNASLNTTDGLVFVWEEKAGVGKYTFELSDSQSFGNLLINKTISGNNYEYSASDLKAGSSLESATYYWRVRVPFVTNNLQSTAQPVSFILGNTYYVDNTFNGTTSSGTRTNPYKTIQPAIDAANASRAGVITTIAEVRVSKGTYSETITMRPNVTVRGGYDSSNNWSRNPQANLTILTRTDAIVVQANSELDLTFTGTLLEGFSVQGTYTASASWLVNLNGVGALTIRNNQFVVNSTATINRIFFINNASGFALIDNTIDGTTTSTSISTELRAIQMINSAGTVRNNIVAVRGPSGPNRVPVLQDSTAPGTYQLLMTNNTIGQFSTTSSSWAMLVWNSSGGVMSGQIDRNIFFVNSTVTGSSRCGQQTGPGSNAKVSSFKNNLFADCNSGTGNIGAYNANANLPSDSNFASPWTTTANVFTNIDSLFRAGNVAASNPTGCGDATACANSISGNRGGNTIPGTPTFPGNPGLDIFTGYVSTNLKTWTMKPNGAADMDNNGAYDATIDAGADSATAGLLAN